MGWSLAFYGLKLTSPSSYAILRGTVIIFTGINSRLFLKHQMSWRKWASLVIIFAGLLIVAMADILQPANSATDGKLKTTNISRSKYSNCLPFNNSSNVNDIMSNEVAGDVLVATAQIFLSAQFVYEEKVLSCYDIEPLQLAGWEGFYGLLAMAVMIIPLSLIDTGSCIWSNSPTPPWTVEDIVDGFILIMNNELLSALICLCIALDVIYEYAAISVTREFSATTRMVLESASTLLVWMASLCIGWQNFKYLQLIGFSISSLGQFVYTWQWQ